MSKTLNLLRTVVNSVHLKELLVQIHRVDREYGSLSEFSTVLECQLIRDVLYLPPDLPTARSRWEEAQFPSGFQPRTPGAGLGSPGWGRPAVGRGGFSYLLQRYLAHKKHPTPRTLL